MIAFAFLQSSRLKQAKDGKKNRRPATPTNPAGYTPGNPRRSRAAASILVSPRQQTPDS
jgi:hypothetical protein